MMVKCRSAVAWYNIENVSLICCYICFSNIVQFTKSCSNKPSMIWWFYDISYSILRQFTFPIWWEKENIWIVKYLFFMVPHSIISRNNKYYHTCFKTPSYVVNWIRIFIFPGVGIWKGWYVLCNLNVILITRWRAWLKQ